MEEEQTKSRLEIPEEDQYDTWEDLTGEYENIESCSTPEGCAKEFSEHMEIKNVENSSSLKESTKENSKEEIENVESCSIPEDFTNAHSIDEEKENGALQKLPSFEILTEFREPDFLKLREDVFTKQQTTFAFENMTTNGCCYLGLKRRVHKNTKLYPTNQDDGEKRLTTKKMKKSRSKKHKKIKRSDLISSTSGLVLALFATNVITFVLGCSLGWWGRDAIPTLAIYEFHLDPALM